MSWKVIKTEAEYNAAVKRTMEIFHAEEGTLEGDELDLLLVLVKDYEDKHIQLPDIDPIEVVKLKMEEKKLKPKDLQPILGSKGHVSSILSKRRELTLRTAKQLHEYFQIPAEIFLKGVVFKKKKEVTKGSNTFKKSNKKLLNH